MTVRTVGLTEARRHLGAVLDHVQAGDRVVLTRRGKPTGAVLIHPAEYDALQRLLAVRNQG